MIIKPLPDLSPQLLADAAAGRIVPFVGAGASRLAGIPGWDHFAAHCLEFLASKDLISYSTYSHLSALPKRTQISIATRISEARRVPIPYADFLRCDRSHSDGLRLYAAISRLGRRFVTTNYDEWLDEEAIRPPPPTVATDAPLPETATTTPMKRNVIFESDKIEIRAFSDNTVVHIHGSVRDPASMVLSTGSYLSLYASEGHNGPENRVRTFLNHLFSSYNVLFIGYGVEENELLEFLLQKTATHGGARTAGRHYLLAPFFEFEAKLAEHLAEYWKANFNVELIPYSKEHASYKQLMEVVELLADRLQPAGADRLRELHELEKLLDD